MRTLSAFLVCIAGVVAVVPAHAAPKQLYNKTVIITWSESTSQKAPDGRTVTPVIASERRVYVSSAGRLFVSGKRSNPGSGLGNRMERGPGEGAGEGVLSFQGNQLVGTGAFHGFARRVVATFDPGFSSCNVTVVYGRSGGASTWKGFDGQTYEVLSISVPSASCSIRDGNQVGS